MTTRLNPMLNEASELDADARVKRALKLIEPAVTVEVAREVEQAWNAEAVRELAAYDAGQTTAVSAQELHARVLDDLRAR